MRKSIIIASLLALGACQAGTATLTAAGVAPDTAATISADTLAAGTLGCQYGPQIAAVVGVKVNHATSAAVAAACSVIAVAGQPVVGAVPAPLPVGVAVPVATVPTPVAAAVAASVVVAAK